MLSKALVCLSEPEWDRACTCKTAVLDRSNRWSTLTNPSHSADISQRKAPPQCGLHSMHMRRQFAALWHPAGASWQEAGSAAPLQLPRQEALDHLSQRRLGSRPLATLSPAQQLTPARARHAAPHVAGTSGPSAELRQGSSGSGAAGARRSLRRQALFPPLSPPKSQPLLPDEQPEEAFDGYGNGAGEPFACVRVWKFTANFTLKYVRIAHFTIPQDRRRIRIWSELSSW